MTSEVCLMNRLAAVLAADSATTVSQWGASGPEVRYFKGANKIFQLSDYHPIGVMIYDSAEILSVPWEICIKTFRKSLADKSFNDVSGFAMEFFNFIDESTTLFPDEVRERKFIDNIDTAALRLLFISTKENKEDNIDKVLSEQKSELDKLSFPNGINEEKAMDFVKRYTDSARAQIESRRDLFDNNFPSNLSEFVEYSIMYAIKQYKEVAGETGIVFAGFGDREIFPRAIHYKECGFVGDNFTYKEESNNCISHDNPAYISPFAQTSMIDTFSSGLSRDLYIALMTAVQDSMGDLARQIAGLANLDPDKIEGLDELIDSTRKSIRERVLEKAREEHALPLRRVLGALPIDEMTELAETLINLQSLKEKVTKPSETVGGPIDVAAITRGEGMIWIKRKHFFDPSLNPRFFQRQFELFR